MAFAASPANAAQIASTAAGADRTTGVPWYLWCGALAVSCVIYGVEWDIAWHRSIGRDTFWTPAHMMIYCAGLITALVCGYLVLATTFSGSARMRAGAVNVFGLRAPLGIFIASWGGLAMITSAPFDNWWHGAYGLDVQVISPPHALLFLGGATLVCGYLVHGGAVLNQSALRDATDGRSRAWTDTLVLQAVFLYMGGLNLMMYMIILQDRLELWQLHSSAPYKMLCLTIPLVLAALSVVSRSRWGATIATLCFMLVRICAILILPLFPATPKLGPVYTPITHLVPAQFPILLIVPALLLDLFWQHTGQMKRGLRATLSGLIFAAGLLGAEWPFAAFLTTPAASSRALGTLFGTIYVSFATHPADRIPHFAMAQTGFPLAKGLVEATLFAMVSSWIGLRLGAWMRTIQR